MNQILFILMKMDLRISALCLWTRKTELNTDDKVSCLQTGFDSSCVANQQVFKKHFIGIKHTLNLSMRDLSMYDVIQSAYFKNFHLVRGSSHQITNLRVCLKVFRML